MKEQLLQFVKQHLEGWQIEQAWHYIGIHCPIPQDTANKIYDLCEEFGEDNDLPENWWLEDFVDEEDILINL